ncbi:serine/threonine protein kinase VRK1-like protein [Trifolium pratense]|uniref:Serine/threonine protein kinase VRK1-like protein n=1 Tax=Trifolium pratense TaxID=57577 RepID=A0A2K3LN65_TRIPR|nr:serine/threonine protein kinase VRK1-like protein [Trifolium pratense]
MSWDYRNVLCRTDSLDAVNTIRDRVHHRFHSYAQICFSRLWNCCIGIRQFLCLMSFVLISVLTSWPKRVLAYSGCFMSSVISDGIRILAHFGFYRSSGLSFFALFFLSVVLAGFRLNVVELDFLYPSEGIHRRWDNGYRITATAATWDQSALILSKPRRRPADETQETLRTSQFPSTHVKEKWSKNLYLACLCYGLFAIRTPLSTGGGCGR